MTRGRKVFNQYWGRMNDVRGWSDLNIVFRKDINDYINTNIKPKYDKMIELWKSHSENHIIL